MYGMCTVIAQQESFVTRSLGDSVRSISDSVSKLARVALRYHELYTDLDITTELE